MLTTNDNRPQVDRPFGCRHEAWHPSLSSLAALGPFPEKCFRANCDFPFIPRSTTGTSQQRERWVPFEPPADCSGPNSFWAGRDCESCRECEFWHAHVRPFQFACLIILALAHADLRHSIFEADHSTRRACRDRASARRMWGGHFHRLAGRHDGRARFQLSSSGRGVFCHSVILYLFPYARRSTPSLCYHSAFRCSSVSFRLAVLPFLGAILTV